MPRCSVFTYQTPAGSAPVDEYIEELTGMAAVKAAAFVYAEFKEPRKGR